MKMQQSRKTERIIFMVCVFFAVVSLAFAIKQAFLNKDNETDILIRETELTINSMATARSDHLKMLRATAEEYLNSNLTESSDKKDRMVNVEGQGWELQPSKTDATTSLGRITGLGRVDGVPATTIREITMVEILNRSFETTKSNLTQTPWIYYISRNDFWNIYPRNSYKFAFYVNDYQEGDKFEIYTLGLPQNNRGRNVFWTKPYIDALEQGLMVTAGIPLYHRDEFFGTICIDMTFKDMATYLKRSAFEGHQVSMVDNYNQIVSSTILQLAPTGTQPTLKHLFHDADLNIQQLDVNKHFWHNYYRIFISPLTSAPWYIVYRESASGFLYSLIFSVLPIIGIVVFLLVLIHSLLRNRRLRIETEIARAKADSANQAKSEFLANMSHELRTPLNGILGYTQILMRNTEQSDAQEKGLNVILTSGRHLLNLINDLLDLAKIEAKKIVLVESDIIFSQFLNDIDSIVQIRAQKKEIPFINKFSADLPKYIQSDRKRLSQVLLNLLSNSIKFTDSGSVTFEVFPVASNNGSDSPDKSNKIRFKVSDTGIGIPEDKLKDVFSAFTQVVQSNISGEGTGLGLTISRQIVQMMGGDIHVESKVNQGSVFWFDLELKEISETAESKRIDSSDITGYKGEKKNILVVDDNKTNRVVLVDLLNSLNFKVYEAVNGRQGLEMVIKIKPDLILLDMVMPEMNGVEVVSRTKKIKDLHQIKIIIVSASATVQMRKDAIDSGADDFITKPVQLDELFEKMALHMKLNWEYTKKSKAVSKLKMEQQKIVFPSKEIMEKLYDYAKQYEYQGLKEQLETIKKEGSRFLPFVEKIKQLTEDYKMDEIIEMLENKKKTFNK